MDEASWAEQDAVFVAARKAVRDAVQVWRDAGGTWADPWDPWAVGPQPSQPELHGRIVAAQDARDELASIACPTDVPTFLERLGAGERDAVVEAIAWLETDPFAQHTGYLKQKVMRRLARAELTDDDRSRLRRVVLALCTRGQRKEFLETQQLARRQLASAGFAADLLAMEETAHAEHTRRAARTVRLSVESIL